MYREQQWYLPQFVEEDRDENVIYEMIINSFQGTIHNWYKNISPNIKNIMEVDVKNSLTGANKLYEIFKRKIIVASVQILL